jgi:hypothetical protein
MQVAVGCQVIYDIIDGDQRVKHALTSSAEHREINPARPRPLNGRHRSIHPKIVDVGPRVADRLEVRCGDRFLIIERLG